MENKANGQSICMLFSSSSFGYKCSVTQSQKWYPWGMSRYVVFQCQNGEQRPTADDVVN